MLFTKTPRAQLALSRIYPEVRCCGVWPGWPPCGEGPRAHLPPDVNSASPPPLVEELPKPGDPESREIREVQAGRTLRRTAAGGAPAVDTTTSPCQEATAGEFIVRGILTRRTYGCYDLFDYLNDHVGTIVPWTIPCFVSTGAQKFQGLGRRDRIF